MSSITGWLIAVAVTVAVVVLITIGIVCIVIFVKHFIEHKRHRRLIMEYSISSLSEIIILV